MVSPFNPSRAPLEGRVAGFSSRPELPLFPSPVREHAAFKCAFVRLPSGRTRQLERGRLADTIINSGVVFLLRALVFEAVSRCDN